MKKTILLLLAFIPFLSNAQTIIGSIMHDGLQRDYILYIPANYSSSTPAPLVLNFHGFGGNGNQQRTMSNFKPIADTAGFIIVHPTGTPLPLINLNHWNVGGWTNSSPVDDVDFTSNLIDSIASNYNVDMARVYSTGFSNGGFFSHKLACNLGYRIAAIASVSGTFTPEMQTSCNPSHPTPVMQIHGTTDPTVPYNGTTANGGMAAVDTIVDYWVTYNNCNSTPTTTNLPDINTTDGSTVERIVYSGGNAGVTVEHLKVTGGDHTWPGAAGNMDISASLEIWKFFSKYTNNAVGIEAVAKEQFEIYPNPAQEVLQIKIPAQGNFEYQLYTIAGRKIFQGYFNYQKSSLDISELHKGFYILTIKGQSYRIIKE